ncbi:ABC transporter permease [Candidatus Phytoplasma pini]|uniref:Oligopeptide transport system permease protein oppB n=1 Tax=Candidatus Phytoplasma pini TaxID=267362 RepID=A0A559KJ33_9MOLU|nr:ABC transporter permease [Candidatus Phytoplasma pini]TVY12142.1 Oligopeptide transport system permease protein oppB [Candidatus Phytoplasma pini]
MLKFFLKKFFYALLIFIIIIIISFFSLKLIPADPIDSMFGSKSPTPLERARIEKELGLNIPISEQFIKYLKNIFFKFDFGNSYFGDKPKALEVFLKAFKSTFLLSIMSCLFGSLIGIFLGVLSSVFDNNSKKNILLNFFFTLILSSPVFIIGFLLQYYLGNRYGLFPLTGFENIHEMFLPILTLSLIVSSSIFRITKVNMEECLQQPYIMTAYAKGLSKKTIIFKHALKNILFIILVHISLIYSSLISGAIITESIFNIKGIGNLMISAFNERNYPVIQCCIIMISLLIITFNLFFELIYIYLNPRNK